MVTDSLAAHYPDHHFEARTADGRLVGVLFTAPVAWDGDEATLGTFDRHVRANYWRALSPINLFTYIVLVLVLRAPRAFARVAAALHRRERQRTTGILLLEILVDPAAQGQGVAGALFAEAAARTRAAGGRWLMSPFRPSGYGRHKSAARAGHDAGTFSGYCALRDRGGRLVDPWLRFLDGHGVRFFRLEPESHIVRRSRRHFDRFRADHRPGDWYEAAPGLWECGETQCWRIEGDRVAAVEPNVWGRLDLTGKAT